MGEEYHTKLMSKCFLDKNLFPADVHCMSESMLEIPRITWMEISFSHWLIGTIRMQNP